MSSNRLGDDGGQVCQICFVRRLNQNNKFVQNVFKHVTAWLGGARSPRRQHDPCVC